ncbi:hypothetical protein GCM10027169_34070 [Gordonia jinhuaensis]|uniref:Part of AAA domain-containing protein n=1 Tax=Gordonia jinhuaensis TaxID=1517702 RepID=A0A916WUI0_9ACTN|nr:AAA domain-containing protein [Gordonia jinhuaensis]GGB31013.1 hypothetical protein GCM10011489_19060 [Gordonia jinhuaensis]
MSQSDVGDVRRRRVRGLLDHLAAVTDSRTQAVGDVDEHLAVLWLTDPQAPVRYRAKARPGDRLLKTAPFTASARALTEMVRRLAEQPEELELVVASVLVTTTPMSADTSTAAVPGGTDSVAADSVDTGSCAQTRREHLLTQRVLVSTDEPGAITVTLAADVSPRIHTHEYRSTAVDSGPAQMRETPSRDVGDATAVLGDERIDALRAAVSASGSVVSEDVADLVEAWARDDPNERSSIRYAPALVLRRRDEGRMLDYLEQMRDSVAGVDSEVPLGLAQLVEPVESAERVYRLESIGATPPEEFLADPLLPLQSNAEQREIFRRLAVDSGVVVEGPAGTGKTHTIANLLTALLATGQRVLVVSEKAQALEVLRDKLPTDLRGLVVDMTDPGRHGSSAFAGSVAEIAGRKASHQPDALAREIAELRDRRDQAIARRGRVIADIVDLRASETVEHTGVADGYSGTAAGIARAVTRASHSYDWLPGPLESAAPPLDPGEFARLTTLLRQRRAGAPDRLSQSLFALDEVLPDSVELDEICERIAASPTEPMVGAGSLVSILSGVESARLLTLKQICDRLAVILAEMPGDEAATRLADSLLAGESGYLWERTGALAELISDARTRDRRIGTRSVEVHNAGTGDAELFLSAAQFLQAGGAWRSRFRRSPQQRALEESGVVATVNGQRPTNASALLAVADHLSVLEAAQTAQSVLADVGIPLEANGSRAVQLDELIRVDAQLRRIATLVDGRDELVRELSRITPGGPRPRSVAELTDVARQTGRVASARDAVLARDRLDELIAELVPRIDAGPSPEGDALLTALRAADATALREARRDWHVALTERDNQGALDLLELRLRSAAPALHRALADDPADVRWDVRVADIEAAWAWRRAHQWASHRSDPTRGAHLQAQLDSADADIAGLTADLATTSAWQKCLDRMSVAQLQAVQSYRDHMINAGKGSGKHAGRFLRGAREAMATARTAVPAWIMPISSVLVTIPPQQNSFDVVIVDEASQADISATFLLWLASRIIVFGDDRQCAPVTAGSTRLDDVFASLDANLPDMPGYLRDNLTMRSSLFSLLRTRFGHTVRLREHFRSMPEIIGFASGQFYSDSPLIPVRQFGGDRLDPLKTVYVPGGLATGEGSALINEAEATQLVETLRVCLDDPRYAQMSVGVVVLQGQGQVDLIERMLHSVLTDDQWQQHRVRVGTPLDFQGDERNVVFLSMVIGADRDAVALTRNESQRRINVATTRAMDQMWLFHSVSPDELKPHDLRFSLLSYMLWAPRQLVTRAQRVSADERVEPFASVFEQRIFNDLIDAGYHVEPKFSVDNLTIDLRVVGADGQMGIGCDGDEYVHGQAQISADVAAECELRRCGWRFWRVRESDYLIDQAGARTEMIATLIACGVHPLDRVAPSEGSSVTPSEGSGPEMPEAAEPGSEGRPAADLSATEGQWIPVELGSDDD